MRLFNSASAELSNVVVTDSGRMEAGQSVRNHGGISVVAMGASAATLDGLRYVETDAGRDRSDGSQLFASVVVNGSGRAKVEATDVNVEGPVDTAVQVTSTDTNSTMLDSVSVVGFSGLSEYSIDLDASGAARVNLADFSAVDSGSVAVRLGDDPEVSLSHGRLEGSGTERAVTVIGTDPQPNGSVAIHELSVRRAPWNALWLEGLASAEVSSTTLANNGLLGLMGQAFVLMGNDTARVTNSTVTENDAAGIVIVGSDSPQHVQLNSITVADNTSEQFAAVRRSPSDIAPQVTVRNSVFSGDTELVLAGGLAGVEREHTGVTSSYSLWNGVSDSFADFIHGGGSGNIVNVDPQLEALADNGGSRSLGCPRPAARSSTLVILTRQMPPAVGTASSVAVRKLRRVSPPRVPTVRHVFWHWVASRPCSALFF